MRILFMSQVLPYPLDAGPKLRAYYTLRQLAQQHEVTLLSFVRPEDRRSSIEHLHRYCAAVSTIPMRRSRRTDAWHLLRTLGGQTPFLIARDSVASMHAQARELSAQSPAFDAVHADQLWMAPYALAVRAQHAGRSDGPAILLDQHNAVFQIPRRLALHVRNPLWRVLLLRESQKLATYEIDTCKRVDRVVWVTAQDARALRDVTPGQDGASSSEDQRNSVIPICVDPETQPVLQRMDDAKRVTFLGGLHWLPNVDGIAWFAEKVWPTISQHRSDAVLTIIGKSPPSRLRAMAASQPRVQVTGYLDQPDTYMKETAVFVVPLHAGGGMRVKILDAWCWGLPVVTTRIGGEGLCVRDGENALLADTPEMFVRAVIRLLEEPELARRIAQGGRRTVEAHYNWRVVYSAWDSVYESLAGAQA